MENEEILFTAESPLGYHVILTADRYYHHIISSGYGHEAHPEFTPEEIKDGIENPVVVYEGTAPDTDVYFSKTASTYPNLYLKVPVATYPEVGEVKTAFLQKRISGGIKDGGIKYANFSNKLR